MVVTTTFTATWDCTNLCRCFSFTSWMNLKMSGKLCHGGSVRLAWEGLGTALRGSAEWLLSAEEASSPLAAKTLFPCQSCSMRNTCIWDTGFWFGVGICWPCHMAVTGPQVGSFLPSCHQLEKTSWRSCQNGKKEFLSPPPEVCYLLLR